MKLLLDTHVLLWSASPAGVRRMRSRAVAAIRNPRNELWVSPLSVAEIVFLSRQGRLTHDGSVTRWIERLLAAHEFREAPLTHEVAVEAATFTLTRQDPIDLLLVATARVYGLQFVTADSAIIDSHAVKTVAAR